MRIIRDFVTQSNAIEGIFETTEAEVQQAYDFLELKEVTLEDLKKFVSIYQPNAELRDRKGLNVMVANYMPPGGDITIKTRLLDILKDANNRTKSPYQVHQAYESLHPFTDCNGRSGRVLWAWMMYNSDKKGNLQRLFLHEWYYQSLQENRRK